MYLIYEFFMASCTKLWTFWTAKLFIGVLFIDNTFNEIWFSMHNYESIELLAINAVRLLIGMIFSSVIFVLVIINVRRLLKTTVSRY